MLIRKDGSKTRILAAGKIKHKLNLRLGRI